MSLKGVYAESLKDGTGMFVVLKKNKQELERLALVPATSAHRNFVLATWVRSWQQEALREVSKSTYLAEEPKLAERAFDAGDVYVLTDPEDRFTIIGWICSVGQVLHHCYVIPDFRRMGVADAMIELLVGKKVVASKRWPYPGNSNRFESWEYNPYRMQEIA